MCVLHGSPSQHDPLNICSLQFMAGTDDSNKVWRVCCVSVCVYVCVFLMFLLLAASALLLLLLLLCDQALKALRTQGPQ